MSRTLLRHSAQLKSQLPHKRALLPSITPYRHSSSFSHLQSELPARKIPITYDYASPTPSHLLNVALADILPSSQKLNPSAPGGPDTSSPRTLPTTQNPNPLPPSHHLIYFPPAIPSSHLLPDGTDPLQSPGEPFIRRMWAGGSVRFDNSPAGLGRLALDGGRLACVERIADVGVKGKEGDEKVFVGISRRVGRSGEGEAEEVTRARLGGGEGGAAEGMGEAAVVERRNIVFMRERSKEQAVADMEKAKSKQLRPVTVEEGIQPTFSHEVTPDAKLLFRYSALSYNAHAIHLDPEYCRDVEGHRGMLVHGPLSFTLILTSLRRFLQGRSGGREVVGFVEYRNLAPLYCGERLRVCGLERERGEDGKGRWEVWAETPEGGVAVKGVVKTEMLDQAVGFGDMV